MTKNLWFLLSLTGVAAIALAFVLRSEPISTEPAGATVVEVGSARTGASPWGTLTSAHAPTIQSPVGGVTHDFKIQEQSLRERIAETPSDTTSLLTLARLLHDAHQDADAIQFYQMYLDVQPNNRQVWLDLATIQASTNKLSDAEESMLTLLQLRPDDTAALYNLGAIYANRGDYGKAREIWGQVRDQEGDPVLAGQAATSLQKLESMTESES